MKATALPLAGGRKKAEPRPRTEGVMQRGLNGRYYARLYPSGSKRAVYRATYAATVAAATSLLPALRAEVSRASRPADTKPEAEQLALPV